MKGFRTVLVAVLLAVFSALEAFDFTTIIPDQFEPFIVPIIPAIFAYLRTLTNTPFGKSE